MFTNRARHAIAATLQGLPLMAQIEDFDPPEIAKQMEELRGGRLVPEKIMTGLAALTATLTINGAGFPILLALGVTEGDDVLLQVREGGKDNEGNNWTTYHTIGGQLEALRETTLKMGDKPVTSLVIAPRTYTRLESGVPVIDIDVRTQKVVIGGVDIMGDVRRSVLMI